ncbi:hypothetical protein Taro_021523 [Colocasia esculenta]|uniref:Uncharacterized protein n=1 Tax=Colocasia esculenta TaxID=4460 RepID=A0A843UZ13_COLES|nr:hypothetical protein [Colocasia esculenta]
MGRSPCCDENGLKKGPWTPEEDQKLVQYIQKHGHGSWRALPKLAGLNRCGKSCRLRWTNYLRPDIKRGKFSPEEEQTILNLHAILGNKWSAIATHLPGRTDNEIKNFWNTHLKKKLIQMGFDPMTHRPRTDIFASLPHLIALANLKELIDHHPWDDHAVRLQVEAAHAAKLQYLQHLLHSATTAGSPVDTAANSLINGNIIAADIMEPTSHLVTTSAATFNPLPSPLPAHHTSAHHPHLSEAQTSASLQQLLGCETDGDACFMEFCKGGEGALHEAPPLLSPSSSLPSLMDVSSMANVGDACSTSSYGGGGGGAPSFWPDLLLDDPFMIDLP